MERRDTTPDARDVQREVWRRLGPEGRVQLVLEMSDALRRLALAGITDRHPDLDERAVVRRYILDVHGVDVGAPVGTVAEG